MKAKKIYQIILVLSGLLLSLMGIACLAVATLLRHDSELKANHAARSRTFATQYWFGLPLIVFGGLVMLMAPSLYHRKKLAAFNVFVCIPLLACSLVASVLHGASFAHFQTMRENRRFLEQNGYNCVDAIRESDPCRCTTFSGASQSPHFYVPCSEQSTLVIFHAALLAFVAVAFAFLLAILIVNVFIMTFFKLQFSQASTGENNEGFSHGAPLTGREIVQNDTRVSIDPSSGTLFVPHDLPPSYESLVTAFDVTSNVTNEGTRRTQTDNRNVRVRYRGQLISSLSRETLRGPAQAQASSQSHGSTREDTYSENQPQEVEVGERIDESEGNAASYVAETRQRNDLDISETGASNEIGSSLAVRTEDEAFASENASGVPSDARSHSVTQRSLQSTLSSSTEDEVYVDIPESSASRTVQSDRYIAVHYRGALDSSSANSIQTRAHITQTHALGAGGSEHGIAPSIPRERSLRSETSRRRNHERTSRRNRQAVTTARDVSNDVREVIEESENPSLETTDNYADESQQNRTSYENEGPLNDSTSRQTNNLNSFSNQTDNGCSTDINSRNSSDVLNI